MGGGNYADEFYWISRNLETDNTACSFVKDFAPSHFVRLNRTTAMSVKLRQVSVVPLRILLSPGSTRVLDASTKGEERDVPSHALDRFSLPGLVLFNIFAHMFCTAPRSSWYLRLF
jgi:hypothetical protein